MPGLAALAERAARAGGLFDPELLATGSAVPVEDAFPRVTFARKEDRLWIRIQADKHTVIERPALSGEEYRYPLAHEQFLKGERR